MAPPELATLVSKVREILGHRCVTSIPFPTHNSLCSTVQGPHLTIKEWMSTPKWPIATLGVNVPTQFDMLYMSHPLSNWNVPYTNGKPLRMPFYWDFTHPNRIRLKFHATKMALFTLGGNMRLLSEQPCACTSLSTSLVPIVHVVTLPCGVAISLSMCGTWASPQGSTLHVVCRAIQIRTTSHIK